MPLDRTEFAKVMTVFSEAVGKKLSAGLLDFYYSALKDMDTREFTLRATELFRSRKYTSFPMPGEFRTGGVEEQDRAMLAAEIVLRTMERVGGDADVNQMDFDNDPRIILAIERMGGWPQLCDQVREYEIDKIGIWKHQFATIYKAIGFTGIGGDKTLLGRHSMENIARGFLNPATGETRNALGATVSSTPWGTKQIEAPKSAPVSPEECVKKIRDIAMKCGTMDEHVDEEDVSGKGSESDRDHLDQRRNGSRDGKAVLRREGLRNTSRRNRSDTDSV